MTTTVALAMTLGVQLRERLRLERNRLSLNSGAVQPSV